MGRHSMAGVELLRTRSPAFFRAPSAVSLTWLLVLVLAWTAMGTPVGRSAVGNLSVTVPTGVVVARPRLLSQRVLGPQPDGQSIGHHARNEVASARVLGSDIEPRAPVSWFAVPTLLLRPSIELEQDIDTWCPGALHDSTIASQCMWPSDVGPIGWFNVSNIPPADAAADDSMVFLLYRGSTTTLGSVHVRHRPSYAWNSSFAELLDVTTMPANVHYVFASYNSTAVQWWRDVALLVQQLSSAFTTLDPQVAAQWQSRLHIAAVPALELLGDLQQVLPSWQFPGAAAVDRFRRWQQVGSLYDWVSAQYQASLLGYTAQHFNFQVEQAAKLAHLGSQVVGKENVIPGTVAVVPLLSGRRRTAYAQFTVDLSKYLPTYNVAEVGTGAPGGIVYDTLLVDAFFFCGPLQSNCPAWDQLGALYVCPSNNPRQHSGDCYEVTRWVSAYHRFGGWVSDISPLLGLFTSPPTFERRNVTFIYEFHNLYFPTIKLLFVDSGKPDIPSGSVTLLWKGGVFDEKYNSQHPTMRVAMPSKSKLGGSATKFVLSALLTGHGWGLNKRDCAEFCPSQHVFYVNGKRVVHTLAGAGSETGCKDLVKAGVVPNQYGTWPFGRAGWCPGWGVPLFTADFTKQVRMASGGKPAVLKYEALLDGEVYQPQPVDDPPANAFEAQIHLSSYAIVYVERPSRVTEVDAWLGALLGIVAVSAVGLVLECAYFLRHGKGKDGQRYAIQLDHDEADVAVHTPTVGLPHDDADGADERLPTADSVARSNGTGSSVEDESKDQSTQPRGSGHEVGTPRSDESHGGSPSNEGLDVA